MTASRRLAGAAAGVCLAALLGYASEAAAASHLWRIHEVFSNRDGSIQYIVLHECCGAARELYLKNLEMESKATGKIYVFPRDLTGSTARKHLLLATEAFAALPGAPAPDFVIPPGFFSTQGDRIWYSELRNYDSFTFKAGALPLDGRKALRVTNYTTDASEVVDNAPINYAGAAGSVEVSESGFRRGDCNGDGTRDISDPIFLLERLFLDPEPMGCVDACDGNDDGAADISDAVMVLLFLFGSETAMPQPLDCGPDPSEDILDCAAHPGCPPGAGSP